MYADDELTGRYLSVVEVGSDFDALLAGERRFHVHSVFSGALNLTDGRTFLTMLPLGRGCGASYATLALSGGDTFLRRRDLVPGLEARVLPGKRVQLGPGVVVDFGRAVPWESPLRAMRAVPAVGKKNMEALRQALIDCPAASPFQGVLEGRKPELGAVLDRMKACVLLRDGPELERAIAAVLGLGPGLTPSGDDLILGLCMARAVVRKAEGRPRGLWEASVSRQLGNTHALSAFFIERALEGRSHEFVESALACLLACGSAKTRAAVERLLGVGATSGFDIGLGLYLALEWQGRYDWCSRA